MSHDLDVSELETLKDQFDELRQRASRSDDIEAIFDAEIRRRFGLMISRAAEPATKGGR